MPGKILYKNCQIIIYVCLRSNSKSIISIKANLQLSILSCSLSDTPEKLNDGTTTTTVPKLRPRGQILAHLDLLLRNCIEVLYIISIFLLHPDWELFELYFSFNYVGHILRHFK